MCECVGGVIGAVYTHVRVCVCVCLHVLYYVYVNVGGYVLGTSV